jgi:hypothetical protein
MKPNLGKLDRIFRFALAVWWIGPWTPAISSEVGRAFITVVGWIALIEAFTAYCWLQSFLSMGDKSQ